MWEDLDLKSFFFFSERRENNWEEYQSSSGETDKNFYFSFRFNFNSFVIRRN